MTFKYVPSPNRGGSGYDRINWASHGGAVLES